MEKESRIVEGFVFPSYKEAQIALKEKQNIELIRQRTPLSSQEEVYELYNKLIERKVFKTLVGYTFLHELRQRLITEFGYGEEQLSTIIIPKRMEYDKVADINQGVMQERVNRLAFLNKRLTIVVWALVFLIAAMFVVAVVNPNVGYINTENKVLNKYSAWEEDLKQRESVVEQKERALNINQE